MIKRSQQLAPLAAAPKAPIASLERVATPELPRASPYDIWRASNASCFQYKGRNYLLVRYVNYELFDTMHRKQKGPGRTRNVLMRLAPGSLTKADSWHELDIVTMWCEYHFFNRVVSFIYRGDDQLGCAST